MPCDFGGVYIRGTQPSGHGWNLRGCVVGVNVNVVNVVGGRGCVVAGWSAGAGAVCVFVGTGRAGLAGFVAGPIVGMWPVGLWGCGLSFVACQGMGRSGPAWLRDGVNVAGIAVGGGRGCVVCWFAGLCGRGMCGNSLNWLAGRSFFDHMVLAASGDG